MRTSKRARGAVVMVGIVVSVEGIYY